MSDSMTSERWKRTEELYHEALTRPPSERATFLANACGDDEALRQEVESLLDEPDSMGDVFDEAAVSVSRMVADLGSADMTGRTIGTYQLQARLGAGGMGEVYLGRDAKLGRDVAIKLLPQAFTSDSDRLARLEREARILAALNHPNICAIYGLEEADGLRFLVLELVPGDTLADRLTTHSSRAKGPGLDLDEVLRIARQITDALEVAHDKGIIHRDLKPSNIKITPDGLVKVLDFGLAKDVTGDPSADLTLPPVAGPGQLFERVVIGTAAYMSPEQASGKRVDRRSDVWSFGVLLFEMLTGRRPFDGETVSETLASVLKTEPDWSALPATAPLDLRRLLRRCLEKDVRRRLQAIGEARVQVEDLLNGASDPTPAPPARTAAALVHRKGIVVAAVAFLIAMVVWGWNSWPRTLQPVAPSFSRVVRLTYTQANEFGPAVSPDGTWIAYLSDARGPIDIWVKFVAGGQASNLTQSTGLDVGIRRNAQLEISPDGTAIAARVRTNSGTETWLIPAPLPGAPRKFIEDAASLRWSPDGRRVAYYRVGQTAGEPLIVAAADGTNRTEIVPPRGGLHLHRPAWSHDGRYVYFVSTATRFDQEPAGIFRVPATGGAIEAVVDTSRRALDPMPMPDGSGLIYAANPTTADLNLWWRPLDGSSSPVRLTTGAGEYAEPRMSADGRRLVATLLDVRQWLAQLPIARNNAQISEVKTATAAMKLTHGDSGDLDPTVAPQGANRLVFSSTRGGSRQLWTAQFDGSEPRPLTSGAGLDERPAISPDGQQVAFLSDRGGKRGIWLIGIEGGTPQFLAPATDVIDMLAWSPDSRQIAYATVGGDLPELRVISLTDKRERKLQTPAGASAPAWSSTDVIAYLEPRRPNSTGVSFINSQGHPLYKDLPSAPNIGFPVVLAWSPDGRRLASAAVEGVWVIEPEASHPFRKVIEFTGSQRPHGLAWTRDGSSLIVAIEETRGDLVLFER